MVISLFIFFIYLFFFKDFTRFEQEDLAQQ